MGKTIAEKILAQAANLKTVNAGDIVEPKVNVAMSHENAALVINQFIEIYKGLDQPAKVWDKEKIVIIFDHRVPAESQKTANNQKKIRAFLANQGISRFHDIRGDSGGICHQILPENGYVLPGHVVVGTDSHTTSHGALGAFSMGIGATEMASVWALGVVLNVTVPQTIKIVVDGQFKSNVSPKDLILYLIGKIGAKGATFKVLEFHGPTFKNMSTSGRLTVCNMSVEAGATSGIVCPDDETVRYLKEEAHVTGNINLVKPDPDAVYDSVIKVDASLLEPQLACPHTVDNISNVKDKAGTKIDQIVIGSCTNGRLDDLADAAHILKGEKISTSTRMLVFPASARIYRQAMDLGYLSNLMDAGATIMNPGCGCCLGVHQGALADGEIALATTNRNFKGRMGNPNASVYLCSAKTAASSAITGEITVPD